MGICQYNRIQYNKSYQIIWYDIMSYHTTSYCAIMTKHIISRSMRWNHYFKQIVSHHMTLRHAILHHNTFRAIFRHRVLYCSITVSQHITLHHSHIEYRTVVWQYHNISHCTMIASYCENTCYTTSYHNRAT
jgi:hypothetical protein